MIIANNICYTCAARAVCWILSHTLYTSLQNSVWAEG